MEQNQLVMQSSLKEGILTGNLSNAPLYAKRAERQLKEVTNTYQRKIIDHMEKLTAFLGGSGNEYRLRYEEKMKKLQKDLDQTGEGKPNANFCPQYREASDEYLKAYNSQLQVYFKEYLQIEKDYLNQSIHWLMFIHYADTYEVAKLEAQITWLKKLKAESPIHLYPLPNMFAAHRGNQRKWACKNLTMWLVNIKVCLNYPLVKLFLIAAKLMVNLTLISSNFL
jgi:hypothetical protein